MTLPTKFEIIQHGGDSYLAAVRLRDEILVNPAGVVTTPEDVAVERELVHVAGLFESRVHDRRRLLQRSRYSAYRGTEGFVGGADLEA